MDAHSTEATVETSCYALQLATKIICLSLLARNQRHSSPNAQGITGNNLPVRNKRFSPRRRILIRGLPVCRKCRSAYYQENRNDRLHFVCSGHNGVEMSRVAFSARSAPALLNRQSRHATFSPACRQMRLAAEPPSRPPRSRCQRPKCLSD